MLKILELGLEDRMNQKVGRMSGGQRQALTLLMAANDSRIDTRREFIQMNYDVASGPLNIELRNATDIKVQKEIKLKLKALKKECAQKAGEFYDKVKAEQSEKLAKTSSPKEKLDALVELSNKLHDYNGDRKILLLDEHTAALDPKTAKAIRDDRLPEDDHSEACSMCGKFCAVRSMNKALSGEYIDIL